MGTHLTIILDAKQYNNQTNNMEPSCVNRFAEICIHYCNQSHNC